MKIEILHTPQCPNHKIALERLERAMRSEGVTAHIEQVLVADAETAESLRFPGSPTIRVNGLDVESHRRQENSFGVMCRLYKGGSSPSLELLQRALREANLKEKEKVSG